eukprot:scaffold317950_cov33-Tisochrysis_lutea.AAC.1
MDVETIIVTQKDYVCRDQPTPNPPWSTSRANVVRRRDAYVQSTGGRQLAVTERWARRAGEVGV